jgi:signal transduction histidine kinase
MRALRAILAKAARRPTLPGQGSRVQREELVVVAAFATVVACFAATTTYSEAIAGALTQQTCAMPDRALPCVVELDRMRAQLREVARLAERQQRTGRGEGSESARLLGVEFDRMEASAANYGQLLTQGDGAAWSQVHDAVRSVKAAAGALLADLAARRPSETVLAEFDERVRHADGALEAAVTMHRSRLEHQADAFSAAEVRAGRTAYALETISVLIAALVVVSTVGMLRRRRQQIESHIDELGQFAARVAHDLRSPLMPPMLALDRIRARLQPDDPLTGNVERGARSLKTIERLVDGLLAFASSGTSRDGAGAGASSVCEMLEAVAAEFTDAAAAGGITLEVDCPSEARVRCSAGTFVSIVGNLVGNAIKYMGSGPERRVSVRVRVGARARIEVSDTGPGIPPGAETRIFEPYVRGHSGGLGIGLGLATVKRLVSAHGGSLGVIRNERRGSTFWVELPLAVDVPQRAGELRPSISS